jgi:hypothetical protein
MPNNISMVQTAWGTVIATVRQQLLPNDICELSPGACSIVAYLAMQGQRDPFAGVHQHPHNELWVINATIKDLHSGTQLVTGPYVSLPEAIQEAARLYAESQPNRPAASPASPREAARVQPAAAPSGAAKPALNMDPKQLDELRRRDKEDIAEYGEVHWEQQLLEILRSK